MKLAFIADIHGNAVALEAVLNDMKEKDIDKVFVLGDLCFRGPEPRRSLELVRSLNTDVIKGNAEEWVVRGIKKGEVPEEVISIMANERDWTYSKLGKEEINYLEQLPDDLHKEYGKLKIHAFHATPNSLFEPVQPFESDETLLEKLAQNDADIHIYGHIHKPYARFINGKCIVNTGSVGLPFDGLTKASYMVMDVDKNSYDISIVRVDYDVNQTIKQFKESDYPNKEFMMRVLENGEI